MPAGSPDAGPHVFGAKSAVKSNGQRLGVFDRDPEGFGGLSRKRCGLKRR